MVKALITGALNLSKVYVEPTIKYYYDMRKLFSFLSFVLLLGSLAAQNVMRVGFVGADVSQGYKRLSYVKAENLSRGWTEFIAYPDTVLEMIATVGIDNAGGDALSVATLPNPFRGSTTLSLQMSQSEDVLLQVYDLGGRLILENRQLLSAGSHAFRLSLQTPQVYLFVATSSQGRTTHKLLNQSAGFANDLSYVGTTVINADKMRTGEHFEMGDFMRYTGYIVEGADTIGSNPVSQSQLISQTLTLVFGERPVVTTGTVGNITGVSATAGGNVVSDGGTVVYYRGVCWATSQNPSIHNSRTTDGTGTGAFTSNITGLTPGTTYYLRAYATNTAGTTYGGEETFVTPGLPTVVTSPITNVGVGSATSGGTVSSDGGAAVTSRGICWSTSPNPTIANSITADSLGTGTFVSTMSQLVSGTTYYVRAYATNLVGTAYGNELSFSTLQLPIVTTNAVSNVVDTSAIFSGTVVSAGDAPVTKRGFCWGTSPSPDTSGSYHIENSSATGTYTFNANGLTGGTAYYVRAFAVSSLGIGYGQDQVFYTLGTPIVVTDSVSGITTSAASFAGHLVFDGGDAVTSRGFCWGTYPDPTTADNVVTSGSGMGAFASSVSRLASGTVFYVRAFATNGFGTGYGNSIAFSTVNPAFSVSPLRKVGFSTGNLQYSAAGRHATADSTAQGTWRFAPNQYDTVGYANALISDTNSGWIDLFGWSTSGYDGHYPYLSTNSIGAYDNGNGNISQTKYDWGTFNAILNGENQPGIWFTLTADEWQYLLTVREGASQKRGFAKVCGVPGVVLLPDSWSNPIGTSFVTGSSNGYATNNYSSSQWTVMESYGAIFLPAAGYRFDSTSVTNVGDHGQYWAATADSANNTHYLAFDGNSTTMMGSRNSMGRSVRLVRLLSEIPEVSTDSILSVTSTGATFYGTIKSEGRDTVLLCGFCWSMSPNPTVTDNVSSFYPQSPAVASYSRAISNLSAGTKYYVRFFAENADGVSYGNELIVTTTGYGVSGKFSVSSTQSVRLAHGNLQYSGLGEHVDFNGDTLRGQWRFAYYHYEMLREVPNSRIADSNTGWIDLLGWGTSGYMRQPAYSFTADSLYGNDSLDINGSRHDWGVNNQIYSTVRDENYDPDTWRTLTASEWVYLLDQRPSASSKVGIAMISGINGIVLLPDDWQLPAGLNFVPGFGYAYAVNTYTPTQWEDMANNGAVFLPAAGSRTATTVSNVNNVGAYWTSTANGVNMAQFVTFTDAQLVQSSQLYRHMGIAVRLAMDEANW